MLFKTTEQHEALRAKIRAFAEAEVKPQAFLMDKENLFPDEAIKKLGEMGLMGIPYPKDIPDNMEIIYVESKRPDGPFGASGTGEIPLCGPHPAIINAIYNACGVRITHLPAYPEKVLAALKEKAAK